MAIILKYLLKNISEKKFRTFLLVFSIAICCALFIGSISITGTVKGIYVERMKSQIGNAEIVIRPDDSSPSQVIDTRYLDKFRHSYEYAVGVMYTNAYVKFTNENTDIQLMGVNLDDMDKMNPIYMVETSNKFSFKGKTAIICNDFAKKWELKIGDEIKLDIFGSNESYKIYGIANQSGVFTNIDGNNVAVVPKETLQQFYKTGKKVNAVYIKTTDKNNITGLINELSKKYDDYQVKETITDIEIKTYTDRITRTFLQMLLAVLLISIFIIYTSFKVIMSERIPIMGVFRSVGASKKSTTGILIGEALVYGFLGGVVGCLLGAVVHYFMAVLSTPEWMRSTSAIKIDINLIDFLTAVFLAVGISLVSSIIPILKINKFSLKNILFNNLNSTSDRRIITIAIGIVFIIVAVIVPWFTPLNLAVIVNTLCIILFIVGILFVVPLLINIFVLLIDNAVMNTGVSSCQLAIKNLRDNKSIKNNVCLIIIGVSCVFMINTARQGVFGAIVNIYDDLNYEIKVTMDNSDKVMLRKLGNTQGVDDIYGLRQLTGTEVEGKDLDINLIWGVNKEKFTDFVNINFNTDNPEELIEQLDKERAILLSNTLRDSYKVAKGDVINLFMNEKYYPYRIIGFFDTMISYGNFALISENNIINDARNKNIEEFDIKTTDISRTVKNIKHKFVDKQPKVVIMTDEKDSVLKSNKQIYLILQFFSLMTVLIGSIGIVNNFIISFIERKKSFAMLRSVGMSKHQSKSMIFIEALFAGTFAGVCGVISGYIMSMILKQLIAGIGIPIDINISLSSCIIYLTGSVLLSLVSSLSMSFKFTKLNIVESLKYE
ncbi:MAG: FtsX-like permease family protein [Clostridiaceae bacterium]|nr:FtsX-like permease family protein [Clostridiaceae bacterium]